MEPNFENCNHRLTREAMDLHRNLRDRFGNKPFGMENADRAKHETQLAELVEQDFLRTKGTQFFVAREIIGEPSLRDRQDFEAERKAERKKRRK